MLASLGWQLVQHFTLQAAHHDSAVQHSVQLCQIAGTCNEPQASGSNLLRLSSILTQANASPDCSNVLPHTAWLRSAIGSAVTLPIPCLSRCHILVRYTFDIDVADLEINLYHACNDKHGDPGIGIQITDNAHHHTGHHTACICHTGSSALRSPSS